MKGDKKREKRIAQRLEELNKKLKEFAEVKKKINKHFGEQSK